MNKHNSAFEFGSKLRLINETPNSLRQETINNKKEEIERIKEELEGFGIKTKGMGKQNIMRMYNEIIAYYDSGIIP